jgi:hypothetical protein
MRWVESATIRPHRCAVIPFVGSDESGFIDTGSEMEGFDNHVYVSVTAVKEMARMIGLPSKAEYNQIVAEANNVARQLEDMAADLADARRELDAIDVIESADYREFKRRKRTGRPPGRKEEMVA